jgi:hypothetical protein
MLGLCASASTALAAFSPSKKGHDLAFADEHVMFFEP